VTGVGYINGLPETGKLDLAALALPARIFIDTRCP
jgi:hypothetical protein